MRAGVAGFFLSLMCLASRAFAVGECDHPPAPVRAYLQAHPDWRLRTLADIGEDYKGSGWKNTCPGLVRADLDGRGTVYVLMLARHGDESKIAVVGRKGWENLLQPSLDKMTWFKSPAVVRLAPGKYVDRIELTPVILKHDAIGIGNWDSSVTAYYLAGGRVKSFSASD